MHLDLFGVTVNVGDVFIIGLTAIWMYESRLPTCTYLISLYHPYDISYFLLNLYIPSWCNIILTHLNGSLFLLSMDATGLSD